MRSILRPSPRILLTAARRPPTRTLSPIFATATPPPPPSSTPATGSTMGAIGLICGSTVGAGILALPQATQHVGFQPTLTAMLVCWALLAVEALLLAETNIALLEARRTSSPSIDTQQGVVSVTEMARQTLGDRAASLVTLIYLFLEVDLITAYVSKGGELVNEFDTSLPLPACNALFAVTLGAVALLGGARLADRVNGVLTVGLVAVFVSLATYSSALQQDWSSLGSLTAWNNVHQTLPIIFLALIYHDLIPVLCVYLNGDRKRIRFALLVGSLIPLGMFTAWEATSLNTLALGFDNLVALGAARGESHASMAALGIKVFSFLAVATSFTCTSLSLIEYLDVELMRLGGGGAQSKDKKKEEEDDKVPEALRSVSNSGTSLSPLASIFRNGLTTVKVTEWIQRERREEAITERQDEASRSAKDVSSSSISPRRLVAFLLALAPPSLLAAGTPDAFLAASSFAGAYLDTLLFGIIPPVMASVLRDRTRRPNDTLVAGGKGTLVTVAAGASIIFLSKLYDDFSDSWAPVLMQMNPILQN